MNQLGHPSNAWEVSPLETLVTGDDETFLARAENPAILEQSLMALCGRTDMEYLVREAAAAISRFASAHRSALRDYGHGAADLSELAAGFSRFLERDRACLDPEHVRLAVAGYTADGDAVVRGILRERDPRRNIDMLGFGCAEGAYELELCRWLESAGMTTGARAFGFDPHASDPLPGLCMLSEVDLASPDLPSFDIIVARWALHHVPRNERWSTLALALRRMRPDGIVLIQEEGMLGAGSARPREIARLELLLACFDVLITRSLKPGWARAGDGAQSPFFLEYLTLSDLASIEAHLPGGIARRIIKHGTGLLAQTFITYQHFAD